MIMVSRTHYDSLLQVVRLASANLSLQHPSQSIMLLVQELSKINLKIHELYEQLSSDLSILQQANQTLEIEKTSLNLQISQISHQNKELVNANIKFRSQLSKSSHQFGKMKEALKKCEDENHRELDSKNKTIQQMSEKSKKYKNLCHQQELKLAELREQVQEIAVKHKYQQKETELDDELNQILQLEEELQASENI